VTKKWLLSQLVVATAIAYFHGMTFGQLMGFATGSGIVALCQVIYERYT
jgi:hypothetical protein